MSVDGFVQPAQTDLGRGQAEARSGRTPIRYRCHPALSTIREKVSPNRRSARFDFNMRTLTLEGSLPFLSVDEIRMACLGGGIAVAGSALHQRVCAGGQHAAGPRREAHSLAEICAMPRCPFRWTMPRRPCLPRIGHIRLEQVGGTVKLVGHEATAELQGTVPRTGRSHSKAGYCCPPTLRRDSKESVSNWRSKRTRCSFLAMTNVPATKPSGEFVRSRPSRWLRFVRDFDGIGAMDLTAKFRKAAGPDSQLEFIEGELAFRNSSAQIHLLPLQTS